MVENTIAFGIVQSLKTAPRASKHTWEMCWLLQDGTPLSSLQKATSLNRHTNGMRMMSRLDSKRGL